MELPSSSVEGEAKGPARGEVTEEEGEILVGWYKSNASRERIKRVMNEMEWHEGRRGKKAEAVEWDKADDAETVKKGLRYAYLQEEEMWGKMSAPQSRVWERVILQRLRFKGEKRWYMVVRTWDNLHRLLVLAVPPEKFNSEEERKEHAARQATYQDDEWGNYAPGMRVQWDLFLPHLNEDDHRWVEQVRRGGIPLQLHERPAQYFKQKNYGSYEQYEEKGEAELQRMVERGVLEGPLHYRPWVVSPMGGVWQPEKNKWRTIHDLTASGVNGATQSATCQYDMLEDILKEQTEDC